MKNIYGWVVQFLLLCLLVYALSSILSIYVYIGVVVFLAFYVSYLVIKSELNGLSDLFNYLPYFCMQLSSSWIFKMGEEAYRQKNYVRAIFYFEKIGDSRYAATKISRLLDCYSEVGAKNKDFSDLYKYVDSVGLNSLENYYPQLILVVCKIFETDFKKKLRDMEKSIEYIKWASLRVPVAGNNREALNTIKMLIYNSYAWTICTSSSYDEATYKEALSFSIEASQLDGYRSSNIVDTLAAAYAANKNFERAMEYQNRAIGINRDPEREGKLRERLALYCDKNAYFDHPDSAAE